MRLTDNPDVLIMGHPILFQEQRQVSLDELADEDFIHNLHVLRKIQLETNGVGLAAPQVGWPVRVLSLGISDVNRKRYPQAPDIPFGFWINPQIIAFSKETCWTWEACLSVPGVRAWIERPKKITVVGYNDRGERIEVEMDGFTGRVMQHELDHLDGKLFPERVEDQALIIPNEAMEHQNEWADHWPTANARITPRGQIAEER